VHVIDHAHRRINLHYAAGAAICASVADGCVVFVCVKCVDSLFIITTDVVVIVSFLKWKRR